MISLAEKIKEIHERTIVKKTSKIMATYCPSLFECLGNVIIERNLSPSRYFDNKAGYEGFRKIWEANHKKKLPEYT